MKLRTRVYLSLIIWSLSSIIFLLINLTQNTNEFKENISETLYFNSFKDISSYFEIAEEKQKSILVDYSSWDLFYNALNSKDLDWILKSVADSLISVHNYNLDFVLIKDNSNKLVYFSEKESFLDKLNNIGFFRDSKEHMSYSHDFILIDNQIYLVSFSPVIDDSHSFQAGTMVIGTLIDNNFKNLANSFIQELHSSNLIIGDSGFNEKFTFDKNYLNFHYPVKDHQKNTLGFFDIKIKLSNFTKHIEHTRESLFFSIVGVSLFFCILLTISLEPISKDFKIIIGDIDKIASGEYHIKPLNSTISEFKTLNEHTLNLSSTINDQVNSLTQSTDNILSLLTRTVELKDTYTKGHSERVSTFSMVLGSQFDNVDLNLLTHASLLHDIGKIGIPESILNKPAALDEEEFLIIKSHPQKGYDILDGIFGFEKIKEIILCHHERFDGNGYPRKLSGDEIPLEAQILAVVDTYDAMTSDRSYRKGMSKEKAIAIIKSERGKQFSPEVVDKFLIVSDKIDCKKDEMT